ncbi:PucR family transcriptional regulator [Erysipelothrix urinaevulpis]|uniref:PucR family transcriptional regulator n=1 Tax=Erysipelothrix urinaevulpis TaxID=2683717 RepID=UPI0013594E53|nr:PucR family transcriptional regulator [Erysipelothrix urinaevulpis]
MITIQAILEQKMFQYLKPLTKPSTLQRKVDTVDLTEAPDVSKYTSPYAFMLTTAMIFKDDQMKLIPFIDSLISVNVAGLGIKTSRFLKTLDPRVIEYADEHNFALVEIPDGTTLGYTAHTLFDFILDKNNQQILYALDIQKFYSNLVINNANINEILEELSQIIETPVFLMNPFLTLSGASSTLSERLTLTDNTMSSIRNAITRSAPDSTIKNLEIRDNQGHHTFINIFNVSISKKFPYYLIVSHDNNLSYPLSDFAIEQSITVLTYIIYKNQKVEETMVQMQYNYFKRIISEQNQSATIVHSLIEQGLNYGLINSNSYRVIICDTKIDVLSQNEKSEYAYALYSWIVESTLIHLKHSLAFFDDENNKTIILMQYNVPNYENILYNSIQSLKQDFAIDVHFGIGTEVAHSYDIKNSYFEALEAIKYANDHTINHFKPKGIYTLLHNTDRKSVQYFIEMHLKDLAFENNEFNNELRRTLKAYLDNQCEISSTADELYLHRNTIIYRIKKAEDILGVDLNDSETTLSLRIALELYESA